MKGYTAQVNIGGDRNHVVHKTGVCAAEVLILQAIHGGGSVHDVVESSDNLVESAVKEGLAEVYGRTVVGEDNDKRPVLLAVYPSWPKVKLPKDAEAADLPDSLMTVVVSDADREKELALAKKQEEAVAKAEAKAEAAEAKATEAIAKAELAAEDKTPAKGKTPAKVGSKDKFLE